MKLTLRRCCVNVEMPSAPLVTFAPLMLRYIAWSTEKQPPEQICASIDRLLPELNHYGGTLIEDGRTGFPDKIKAREEEFRGNWAQTDLRNDRMCELVGITFRPFDESLRDCVESLISVGEVQVKTRDSKL